MIIRPRTRKRRLWCVGEGESWRCVAETREAAELALGGPVRSATPDDCRRLWLDLQLYKKPVREVATMFGVSRQAIDIWRAKGGDDLPRRCEVMQDDVDARILPLLDSSKCITQLAAETGETVHLLRAVARRHDVRLASGTTKKPSDDEIIRLAEGRTWRELAAACGVHLATLRNYVYARPSLSAQVTARIRRQPSGPAAHGKVDGDVVRRMVAEGASVYAIAQHLQVEQMTIRHWFKKLGLRRDAQ
jgi:DNA-directed RNA polymerase specialized sigma24 family protein